MIAKDLLKKVFNQNDIIKQLRSWEKKDKKNPNALTILDRKHWSSKLENMILNLQRSNDLSGINKAILTIEAFYQSSFECLRPFLSSPHSDEVILVTAVKNNQSRIEHFLNHYRKIGVKFFVFIDNGSTDDTVKIILEQKDTACYKTLTKFTSETKTAWFNRVAAIFSPDNWFIMVDSDELLAYPEMSRLSIQEYTKILQEKDIDFVKTLMLDVYPSRPLMDESMTDEEYLATSIYFDKAESYAQAKNSMSLRSRLFLDKKHEKPNLNKPALFRFSNYFLLSSHYVYPKSANERPHGGAVLHYKFLPSDKQNYVNIVNEGAYYENDLKVYASINKKVEELGHINPMCDSSVLFDPDESWKHLPFIVNLVETERIDFSYDTDKSKK